MQTLIVLTLVLLVVNQSVGKTCNSNSDCPSTQCCSDGGNGLLHILRTTNTRTCSDLAGVHQTCPVNGAVFSHACGCQHGLTCYVAPSGIMPRFGQCITQAEYQEKLEWIKNNPWVQMIP